MATLRVTVGDGHFQADGDESSITVTFRQFRRAILQRRISECEERQRSARAELKPLRKALAALEAEQ